MRSIPLRLWVLRPSLRHLADLTVLLSLAPCPMWRRLFCWFCLVPLLYALLECRSRRKAPASLSCRPSRLRFRSSVVCGKLLLDLPHHAYLRKHSADCILRNSYSLRPYTLASMLRCSVLLLAVLHNKFSRNNCPSCAPFAWVAVELARARITGFPWDLLGYTQVDNLTLTRLAPWTGVMGISFVIAAVNVSLAHPPCNNSKRLAAKFLPAGRGALFVVVITLAAACASHPIFSEPTQAVATLLQENLSVGSEAPGE